MPVNAAYKEPWREPLPLGLVELRSDHAVESSYTTAEPWRDSQVLFRHGYGTGQACDNISTAQDVADYARFLLTLALQQGAT